MISRSVGWATLFLVGTDLFVVSPLLPRIAGALGVSVGSAGLMVTVFSLAYVAGGPRLGALADRTGHGRVLAGSLAAFACANVVTGLAPGFAALLAARALAGLAASGVTPSVYAMVGAAAPRGLRATWLAVVTSGLLLSLSTGAPAGALLATVVGWRGVFLVLAGSAAALLGAHLRGPRGGDPGNGPPPAATAARGAAGTATRIRAVGVTGLWALAVYGVYTYLGAGLRASAGFDTALVAAGLAVYGIGAIAGNLLGGPLADRRGPRPVTTASLAALAAAEAALGLALGARPAVFAALALLAFAAYPYFSAHQNRLIHAFPAQSGTILAWNNTAMYLGILVGSLAGGPIIAAASFRVLIESAAAVALLGAAATRLAIAPPATTAHGSCSR